MLVNFFKKSLVFFLCLMVDFLLAPEKGMASDEFRHGWIDIIHLTEGHVLKGEIIKEGERVIFFRIREARLKKGPNIRIREVLQKRNSNPMERKLNSISGQDYRKLIFKDGSEYKGYFRELNNGDVQVIQHEFLPDKYIIKKESIRHIESFPRVIVELASESFQSDQKNIIQGLLTAKDRGYYLLEKIQHDAKGIAILRDFIKEISRKPILRKRRPGFNNPGETAGSYRTMTSLSFFAGYLKSRGDFENFLDRGLGTNFFFRRWHFISQWIPGLNLNLAFSEFSSSQNLVHTGSISLQSLFFGLGPVWRVDLASVGIKFLAGTALGISRERIKYSLEANQKEEARQIQSADFALNTFMGLEYSFGRMGIAFLGSFGYSYDRLAPLYQVGLHGGLVVNF